jgi:hypothetical protein
MTQTSHSFAQQTELSCLQCWQTFETDLWQVVDIVERPDLLEKIILGKLHDFPCPNCSNLVYVNAPLLIYHPGGNPTLIFSPAHETTSEQDQEQAMELLNHLRQNLGDTWQEEWLSQIPGIPREILPFALQDGLESATRLIEERTAANLERMRSEDPQAYAKLVEKQQEAELLRKFLRDFIQAKTWAESQQIVEQHPELLTEAADRVLGQWIKTAMANNDVNAERVFSERCTLLQRCREIGIAPAFQEKTASVEMLPERQAFLDDLASLPESQQQGIQGLLTKVETREAFVAVLDSHPRSSPGVGADAAGQSGGQNAYP